MSDRPARLAPYPMAKPYRGPRPGTRHDTPRPEPRHAAPDAHAGGPAVVAIGGGTGLSIALRAIRRYAGGITAVVSVADDGGSSGRLRRDLGVPAPGDLRKCLVALAGECGPWSDAFEHRFSAGELRDHALGNLLLVGLYEALGGDLTAALDEAARLLRTVGRVLPATADPVTLAATVGGEHLEGQVAIEGAHAPVRDVRVVPDDPPVPVAALDAIRTAVQIVVAPGSLYTSVLAPLCVPGIRSAVADASARVVMVGNVAADGETTGLSGTDQLRAVLEHRVRIDTLLYDPECGLAVDEVVVKELDVMPVAAPTAAASGGVHDPTQLASALSALL